MSRRRKTKAKKDRLLEPAEVLDGSVEYRIEELFDLIHRVNPTRDRVNPSRQWISKKELVRRYTLKNRLQSLLIRRFGDDHLKVETTEQAGVISLEHISGLRDACHAIAAELEPDARSWVRRQLDLAAHGDEELRLPELDTAETSGVAGEVEDLLERGRQALEEYDYERAEDLLRRAFEASPDAGDARAAAAATALLELQVDLLGLDAVALELDPRLPPALKQRPAIRTLLALAAARTGDAERALELVAGLNAAVAGVSLPRAAEVYAALTSRAIRDRDRRAARRHLECVVELDPTHAGIPAFETEIGSLRAEELSGDEAELERRFQELGAAEVEEDARALADRWPEGEVARRILRQAAAERRRSEIAELLELAESARGQDRFDDAARHFQAALDAGCERPDLPALVAELSELAREEHQRSAVEGVLRRFAEAEAASRRDAKRRDAKQRDALLAYLSLAEDLRSRVRGDADRPVLGWLEEIQPPRHGSRVQAAMTAVLALERAGTALERGDAEDAAGLIEPHRAILGRVAHARGLGREASRQIAERRRRRALEALALALEAFDQGRPEDARHHLAAVPRGDLEAADQVRIQDLQARIDGLGVLERLEHEHDQHLAAGDLPAALARARRLAEETQGDDAAGAGRRWSRAVEEIQERIRAAWRLEVVAEVPDLKLADALQPSTWLERSVTWLDDDGRELVIANAWGRWLFLDAVDVARDRITARVSLRAPGVLERPLLTTRDGDRLWIAGRNGNVLEIARDGFRILGFYAAQELLAAERKIDRARPMPGGRWLWLRVSEWGLEETCLVDLREWRLGRRLPSDRAQWIAIPGDNPRMLVLGLQFAARLYTVAGEPTGSEPLVQESLLDADRGPDGRGLLLLISEDDEDAGQGHMGLQNQKRSLARFTEASDGTLRLTARYELTRAHRLYVFQAVVTSPDRSTSFVMVHTRDEDKELLVFSGDGPPDRLEPLARSSWPNQTALVHDRRGRHVAALESGGDLRCRLLDPQTALPKGAHRQKAEPEAHEGGRRPTRWPVSFPTYKVHGANCSRPTGSFGAMVRELAKELEEQGVGSLRTHLARVESSSTRSVDDKLLVALALRQNQRAHELRDVIEGFARRTVHRYPDHPGAVLLLADIEAVAENWQAVSRLMRRADPAALDDSRARHFHHLEGLAHLHGGRLDEAHEALGQGMAHQGACPIGGLIQLTQPMADPPSADDWGPDQPAIRRLVGALRTADRALAAGDPAAARAALDRRDVRWYQELQTAARRASAYLAMPPSAAAGERFDERLALAFYAQLRQDAEQYSRHDLFLPDLSWDEERLAELEERVVARLEEL